MVEATEADLVADHPRFEDLIGADVCVMHAAYSSYPLIRSGAIGWRGQISSAKAAAMGPAGTLIIGPKTKVEVFGSWFILTDGSLIRPIRQSATAEAVDTTTAQQQPTHVGDGGEGMECASSGEAAAGGDVTSAASAASGELPMTAAEAQRLAELAAEEGGHTDPGESDAAEPPTSGQGRSTTEAPMTEAEALRLAADEGLQLVLAPGTTTGYKGVSQVGSASKPFYAHHQKSHIGCYASAAEAALAFARYLGPESCRRVVAVG